MKKRVVLKMLKITANLKTGRLETLTANPILDRQKLTAKKNQLGGGVKNIGSQYDVISGWPLREYTFFSQNMGMRSIFLEKKMTWDRRVFERIDVF